MADTAGSAAYVANSKDKSKTAIKSKQSAKFYNLDVLIKFKMKKLYKIFSLSKKY